MRSSGNNIISWGSSKWNKVNEPLFNNKDAALIFGQQIRDQILVKHFMIIVLLGEHKHWISVFVEN